MATIKVRSMAFTGIEAVEVEVEVQKSRGLYGKINIVGLPGNAVRESKDRVRAAIESSGFDFPRSALVINLAPADLKKEGPSFDLPLAIGILGASGVISKECVKGLCFLGELALDGRVKPVFGVLGAAIAVKKTGKNAIMVAAENQGEAQLIQGLTVIPVHHLGEAVQRLGGPRWQQPFKQKTEKQSQSQAFPMVKPDFKDVIGQEAAKIAMVTAAAGGHNLLMIGPPGAGKTMLAKRLPTILPPLNSEESLDVSRIHSLIRCSMDGLITEPPFRAPHHTISYAGMVGGGAIPKPGEISLAHKGILFLDELPEFHKKTLEALRQPLEEGVINISRVRAVLSLPAQLCMVASMNPCPCGYRGDGTNQCVCSPRQAELYFKRLSGPLLDRLDLQIEAPAIKSDLLQKPPSGLDSKTMKRSVLMARDRQAQRSDQLNSRLTPEQVKKWCIPTADASSFLGKCLKRFPLSARGYSRILKVARTVADLDSSDRIRLSHMEQAVMFRSLDRMLVKG